MSRSDYEEITHRDIEQGFIDVKRERVKKILWFTVSRFMLEGENIFPDDYEDQKKKARKQQKGDYPIVKGFGNNV